LLEKFDASAETADLVLQISDPIIKGLPALGCGRVDQIGAIGQQRVHIDLNSRLSPRLSIFS
jgi:hypothetical protein